MNQSVVYHRQSIDLARFIAAFGVVVSHSLATAADWVGNLSIGLFLILTAFLAIRSMERAGGRYSWAARARRLMVPWLFWCVVFRVVNVLVSDDPARFNLLNEPMTLLIGPSVHLWYLPFVAMATVLVAPVGRILRTEQALAWGCIGFAALALVLFAAHGFAPLPMPVQQWAFGVPMFVFGLLLAVADRMGRAVWPLATMALITLVIVSAVQEVWAVTPLVAALAFALFWRLPLRGRWLAHLGQVSFGIYLMHPFFMLVIYKLVGSDVHWLALAVLAFGMSWVAAAVMRYLPFLSRMV